MKNYPIYIGNKPVMTKQKLDVFDKYTTERVARVSLASSREVEKAIALAVSAREAMAAMPAYQRADILMACVEAFTKRRDELAESLCIEAGKPIKDARVEADRLIDTFRIAAGEATRINGEQIEMAVSPRAVGLRAMTKRVPLGVLSFITPFNFPLNLVAHKVAPAIAAGCPFILKPSERTPLGALIIADVLSKLDLPKGAFSVLACSIEDAQPLITDDRIAMLSFTGGQVGWKLKSQAGHKAVTLELGGNAVCIVDEDPGVPLDHVVDRLAFGAYYQSGQSCIAVQRILVHDAIYDSVKRKLKAKVKTLKSGNPHFTTTFVGPMIDEDNAIRVEEWVNEARKKGAKILVGGERKKQMLPAYLLENVPDDAKLATEEVFGPVCYLERYSDFKDALKRANDTAFGLQAGVFTASIKNAMKAWDVLEVGGVIVGDIPSVRVDNMPYGGAKASGIGLEGVKYAINEMTRPRLLMIRD